MPNESYSAGLWVFAQSEDKYGGYARSLSVHDQILAAASVPGLKGLELIAPIHVSLETMKEVQGWMKDAGMQTVAVNPYLWTEPQWERGALTSPDPQVRRQAVDTAKRAIEIGRFLGCDRMCLWPGEDGWDYLFQVDYRQLWDNTAECLREIAEFDRDYQIGIEYKMSEPRMYQLVSSAAKAAMLGSELGLPNIGAYLDYGHALMAKEIPADTVAFLMRSRRLVGVHVNDNYGLEDNDLMVGSIHFWSTLEFLVALKRYGYQGWISLDIVPRRESPVKASAQSIVNLQTMQRLADRLDLAELAEAQAEQDAIAAQRLVQQLLAS